MLKPVLGRKVHLKPVLGRKVHLRPVLGRTLQAVGEPGRPRSQPQLKHPPFVGITVPACRAH